MKNICFNIKRITLLVYIVALLSLATSCQSSRSPQPYGVLPEDRQVKGQEMERYAFLHFSPNTFTDKEWGYGDEDPDIFNPTNFDADQIIATLAKTGFKGAIITAKHHDGFCLWQTKYSRHSVASSKWKDGKGDVVAEISKACKKYGIKFGVYLSPWDRNAGTYGSPAYITYYKNQLTELLTNYGEVFEVWFDGANGGDGYYGGRKEMRTIDKSNYYPWDEITKIIRILQPDANIFSDVGPDIRWVGNERGYASDTSWATYTPESGVEGKKPAPGLVLSEKGEVGTPNGKYWMPAETDVSIRPGWFWHEKEDAQVKTLEALSTIYLNSVGHNTTLLLNIPPTREGKISAIDSTRLVEFNTWIESTFKNNLLKDAKIRATDTRKGYAAANMVDENPRSYWTTANDTIKTASLSFVLPKEEKINYIVLQEYIQLGQRIKQFSIDILENDKWKTIANGTTVGYKRIVKLPTSTTKEIRINITDSFACPVLSKVSAH